MTHRLHRWPLLAGLLLAAAALAGCEDIGRSGLQAELARARAEKGFAVLDVTPHRAVFAARGQRIVVEPPEGYCLDKDSIDVTSRSAYALVTDCLEDLRPKLASAEGSDQISAIDLPRSFPGILTVSISGDAAFGSSPEQLGAFEKLLGSPAGLKLLGRGAEGPPGKVVMTRRIGGALYVLIEEAGPDGIFGRRFWRAFCDINGRLVLVSVSSFADRPVGEDAMMGFLAHQMQSLRHANGMPEVPDEEEVAHQMEETLDLKSGQDTMTVVRADAPVDNSDGADPVAAPVPPERGAPLGKSGADGTPMPPPRVVLAKALARASAAAGESAAEALPQGSAAPLPPSKPGSAGAAPARAVAMGGPAAPLLPVAPTKSPVASSPAGAGSLAPATAPPAPKRK